MTGKKDYWDYFRDCLSGNKYLKDGLHFVKSLTEVSFKHNSLLLNLTATLTNRLQLVLNSAAYAGTKTPKFHHIMTSTRS